MKTSRAAAIRLLRILVARGLCSDAPLADAAIRNFALQAGLDNEFNMAWNYALQQGWLVNVIAGWSRLSPIGDAVAKQATPSYTLCARLNREKIP
jgi:hypothetical protein